MTARPPRHATPRPADRAAGSAPRSLDALAALRGRLQQAARSRASEAASAPTKTPQQPTPLAPSAVPETAPDERSLFLDSVRDVTPLADTARRAEIAVPKPPPLPRPKSLDLDPVDPPPALPDRARLDGSALFRSEMNDVTPLRRQDHAEIGFRRSIGPRVPGEHPDALATATDMPLLLPPDPDTAEPGELFRYANRGTQPLDTRNRVELERAPPRPEPLKRSEDEQAALRESLDAPMSLEDRLEMGDEAVFLRPGLPRRVLTDLRRGRWVLQGEVDLHGYNRDEAREALAAFLSASLQRGRRCVRVIHGKGLGSPGKLSILKQLSRGWLAQREEILAFCQAGPYEGGSGALLVLLKTPNAPKG